MTRFDRWSRDGMPDPIAAEKIQQDISRTMRDVLANPHISQSASMIPDKQRAAEQAPRPSGGTVPIGPPPGVELIDRMVEEQSRRERLLSVQEELNRREIEKRLAGHDPYKAKTSYDPLKRYDEQTPSLHRDNDE